MRLFRGGGKPDNKTQALSTIPFNSEEHLRLGVVSDEVVVSRLFAAWLCDRITHRAAGPLPNGASAPLTKPAPVGR